MFVPVRRSYLLVICVLVFACSVSSVNATAEDVAPILLSYHYPAWSPDGQYIAFLRSDIGSSVEGQHAIWLIRPDGTDLQCVVADRSVSRPGWSPDSSTLYFLEADDLRHFLKKKVLSTGAVTQVVPGPVIDYSVSNSGQKIIAGVTRDATDALIIVLASTGNNLRWFTTNGYDPSWSPNDEQAVFVRGGQLWVGNTADRTGIQQITSLQTEGVLSPASPDWSSNGIIAFDYDGGIYTINPDGSGLTCVFAEVFDQAEESRSASSPRWSPDGSKLVFVRVRESTLGSSEDLWIINSDGTGLTQLTRRVVAPVLEPDGREYGESRTVTIDETKTLKAKAWKKDFFPSAVSTRNR